MHTQHQDERHLHMPLYNPERPSLRKLDPAFHGEHPPLMVYNDADLHLCAVLDLASSEEIVITDASRYLYAGSLVPTSAEHVRQFDHFMWKEGIKWGLRVGGAKSVKRHLLPWSVEEWRRDIDHERTRIEDTPPMHAPIIDYTWHNIKDPVERQARKSQMQQNL